MSIRARIDDALFLWDSGRREGALLSALAGVAATCRRIWPDRTALGDRECFERFQTQAHSVRLSVEYRGAIHTIEHVLYKWLRCELIHEGGLPTDIQFVPDPELGVLMVRAGGAPHYVLQLSQSWFHHLVGAVVQAPVNADQFKDWGGPQLWQN